MRYHRGFICASSELRLIIITNDKQVVLGSREELDEPRLGSIDVLELVDAQVAETGLPPAAKSRIGLERRHRAHHQVVKVDEPARLHQRRKGVHRGRRPPGRMVLKGSRGRAGSGWLLRRREELGECSCERLGMGQGGGVPGAGDLFHPCVGDVVDHVLRARDEEGLGVRSVQHQHRS